MDEIDRDILLTTGVIDFGPLESHLLALAGVPILMQGIGPKLRYYDCDVTPLKMSYDRLFKLKPFHEDWAKLARAGKAKPNRRAKRGRGLIKGVR